MAGAITVSVALALGACGQESAQSLTAKAEADLAKKDAGSAVIRLKQALQAGPESVETRTLLGRALLEAGDPGGAVVELSKSLDQKGKPGDVMPALARAMLLSGQEKKLVTLYADVKLEDVNARAAFQSSLATAWALGGDRVRSEAVLAAALAAVPEYPDAMVLQARLMAGRGEFEPAMAVVDKVLSRNPRLYEAWHLKGEIQAVALRDTPGAEASFRKAVEIEKAYLPAQLALVSTRIRENDLPGARKQLEELRSVAPGKPDVLFIEAQLFYFEKNYAKSRELVQRLLTMAPDHTGLLQLSAAVEWQSGSLVQAERNLATAVQLDPTLAEARTNLAHIYNILGQPARALEAVKPLIEGGQAKAGALSAAGQAALQAGNLAGAESYFSRAASASGDDGRASTALALTRLARGDSVSAFAQLESLASKTSETYPDIALVSARLRRNELDAALAAADGMVGKQPGSATAHDLRGRVLVARQDWAAARLAFDKALAIEPRSISSVVSLAEIDLREKQPEQAKLRYQEVLKADPRNHLALMGLADLRLKAGAPMDEVRDAIADAIKAAPNEPYPRIKLIELLARQRQITAALAAAQEAATALPNDVQVLDALGRMQLADGNKQQALSTFRRLVSIDPMSATAHLRMADVHRADGQRTAAVASLRRALEIDPQLKVARITLVDLLVEQKRPKEAIDIAKELQRRDPQSPGGYLLEAAVHRKLKDHGASAVAYRAGLKSATDRSELALNLMVALMANNEWKQAEAFGLDWLGKNPGDGAIHYYLGEGYIKEKKFDAAERRFSEALKLRPDYVPALNNLAWVLVQQGKRGATVHAQRAVSLQPNQPELLDTLASALAAENLLPKALEAQQQAVKLAPGDSNLRLHLAKLAIQAGDKATARAELERIAAAGTRGGLRDEATALLSRL